jgi:uncharacterized protein YqgV (UPF0045/DUF77 family)
MSTISLQLSVYPLRQRQFAPAVEKALEPFRAHGLDVRTGSMSTAVFGESDAVFDALRTSFSAAASLGDVVMVATVSNCCPAPAEDRRECGAGK